MVIYALELTGKNERRGIRTWTSVKEFHGAKLDTVHFEFLIEGLNWSVVPSSTRTFNATSNGIIRSIGVGPRPSSEPALLMLLSLNGNLDLSL